MVEIKNNNNFKVGDKVWWFDAWDNLRWGIIYKISEEKVGKMEPVVYASIYEEGKKGSHMGAKISECWPSKEACLDADRRKNEAQKAEYIESIKDVNDLVQFLFDHDMVSEFRDYPAIAAAKQRAKELLGYEIKE